MLQLRDYREALLVHLLAPAGPIPTVADPDGVYPYPSYVETSQRPVLKTNRFVTLENDHLRATICPDLGGKVYSLFDKSSGQEALFVPQSVRPVRILPRMAFIPGGIEVSFPISHTPVQLEPVDCRCEQRPDRLYVWCGERELHRGLQWTVEYSLGRTDHFLTQRTCFHNPTTESHPWMSWSNAAVPARPDSEFQFPNGPVLAHGADLRTVDWRTEGPRRLADLDRMVGFFWLEPNRPACGVYTPSLRQGLYHLGDPKSAPGLKLWSYGVGRDEIWGRAGSLRGESYIEIQGGPIRDQSIRKTIAPGESHSHVECWLPSASRLDLESLTFPAPHLVPFSQVPWFDWPPRPAARYWLSVLESHRLSSLPSAPLPPGPDTDLWAPRAMNRLGDALRWLIGGTSDGTQNAWRFQLGTWLAAGGETDAALAELAQSQDDRARALAARLYRHVLSDPCAAASQLRAITNRAFALHPQVVVERDLALSALGTSTLAERQHWLDEFRNSADEWISERRVSLLLDQGKPAEAQALLASTHFQLVHQRYTRSELWNRLSKAQGRNEATPPTLGEDDLAQFGAYRQTE